MPKKSAFKLAMEDDFTSEDKTCLVLLLYFVVIIAVLAWLGYMVLDTAFAP